MYDLYMFTSLYITFLKRLARQIEIRNLSSENLLVAIRAFIMLFDHLAKTDVLKESASEIFIMQIKSVIFAIRKTGQRPDSTAMFNYITSKYVSNTTESTITGYITTLQFVIFKPLSYCFKETIVFDVKASSASRPVSRLIR